MMKPLALAILIPALASATSDAATTRVVVAQRSLLVLTGSSNLAPWQCRGSTLNGAMEVDTSIEKINEVIDRIEDGNMSVWMSEPSAGRFPQPRFELTIPVETLHCGGGRMMERDLKNALNADRHPFIRFRFIELSGAINHDMDQHLYHAVISGQLSLAGTIRKVEVTLSAVRLSGDRFRLRTELPLRMSDFGIAPPTALFGLIHANNALQVDFDLFLEVVPDA